DSGEVAFPLRPEPYGGGDRGLSMGATWQKKSGFRSDRGERSRSAGPGDRRDRVLQADGTDLRGCGVMSDVAIRAETLSKQYRIAVRQYRHDTLRDQVAHSLRSLLRRNG